MRAVICVLHPDPPSEDTGELVEWFLQMIFGATIETDAEDVANALKSIIGGQ